jgi:4-diphosphocytidyl-2-C-methyl-D-erythritol kinase
VSAWRERPAPAKLNLSLVVGPQREDGKHEIVTVMERLSLADSVAVRRATSSRVSGFEGDTLVRAALDAVSSSVPGRPRFEARIEKRIPVAAGLGGGSSDAAAALLLASELVDAAPPSDVLERLAASLGADVPFFLHRGAQLGTADGTVLEPLDLPRDYTVVLALPHGAAKGSTGDVYAAFDARGADEGFPERRTALLVALARVRSARDLAGLPGNDLASSTLGEELCTLGAFRGGVSGAGPTVYGLFADAEDAARAAAELATAATTWVVQPG